MKAIFSLMIFIAFVMSVSSQGNINIEQIAHVPNSDKLSDVWGYVAGDGTEYAIIGTRNATEIYSLSDPASPQLVKTVPGANSVWRDMKVLGNYIYVVADQAGSSDGVIIIDMTKAPEEITFSQVNPLVGGDAIQRCHNLYIDTSLQVMFLAGCNGGNSPSSGVTAFDIGTDPKNPQLINTISTTYSHDVFVRDNLVFSSEVFAGQLSIFDIMDIMNPLALGSTPTTNFFTHNAWSSDDNQYVYTTDEVANGTIDAYDISDLNNPIRVDVFVPAAIEGQGITPHNTHFLDDFLITSWYDYGIVITDISTPDKIVETGHFNTGENPDCWGVYPYLPSGLILASDINNGLFVLKANYERAAYLSGLVTDSETGGPIFNASVKVISDEPFGDNTSPSGKYTAGQLSEGTFMVEFNHPEYDKLILEATLEKGENVELNASLTKSPIYNQTIRTIDAVTGLPLDNVEILLQKEGLDISRTTDSEGFLKDDFVSGEFQIIAGKWGYKYGVIDASFFEDGSYVVELERGYQDDFVFDYGWMTEAANSRSEWVREVPIGTKGFGQDSNPSADVEGDIGSLCYVTGNGIGRTGAFDVDDSITVLTSPFMDLSEFPGATLKFSPWFFNGGSSDPAPNDTFNIFVTNGTNKVLLLQITENTEGWTMSPTFKLADFVTLSEHMQIIFEAGDQEVSPHWVEAGVDAFLLELGGSVSVDDQYETMDDWTLFPNPVTDIINLQCNTHTGSINIEIYTIDGKLVSTVEMVGNMLFVDPPSKAGLYFVKIRNMLGDYQNIKFVVI